jgi:6-phosphogluconolactonase
MPLALRTPPAGVRVHTAASGPDLAQALAQRVAVALREGLAARGRASLWVSGGSTPVPFFQALSHCQLAWARVRVALVDERWCPPTEADSNARLVTSHLLQHEAAAADWLSLYRPQPDSPFDAQALVHADLDASPWPADVVILGMGGDGHTASWFPETPEYAQAVSPNETPRGLAVSAPGLPNVPRPRYTLTLGAVRDTRLLCLHLTGVAKADLLGRIWSGDEAHLPMGTIWSTPMPNGRPKPPVEVFWSP